MSCSNRRRFAVALGLVLLGGCSTQIQQGLDERQANELQAALTGRGFSARKVMLAGKKPTWSVEVDDAHAEAAVRLLAELGLPRPRAPTSADVLAATPLVPSAQEELGKRALGLAGDLAQTLETVDGVASARVHVVLPLPARAGQPPAAAKASAFVRLRPGTFERLAPMGEELKALVAGSVEGLEVANVTLVMTEVASTVLAPEGAQPVESRLRTLGVMLAVLVSLLAIAVIALALRARRGVGARTATASPVPVVGPARRAA